MKGIGSFIISVVALVFSVLSIFAPPFVEKLRDSIPDLKRSVSPGTYKVIYDSKLTKPRLITLDVANISDIDLPALDSLQLTIKNARRERALKEAEFLKMMLIIRDSEQNSLDSISIKYLSHATIDLEIPPKGSLILICPQGTLSSFCSYEFLNIQ